MINRKLLPYRPGDILYITNLNVNAMVIGYLFPYGYNKYRNKMHGYTVKILDEKFIHHNIGIYTFTFTGKNISDDKSLNYWWLLSNTPVKLVRHSNIFLCNL